jgi:predicted ATPase
VISLYQRIEIKNFKSLKKVSINPSLITIITGANGSGKSSILQALMLLKQSINQSILRVEGPIVNLGNCQELLFKGSDSEQLGFQLTGFLRPWSVLESSTKEMERLNYDIAWSFDSFGRMTEVQASIESEFASMKSNWNQFEGPKTQAGQAGAFTFEVDGVNNIFVPMYLKTPPGAGEQGKIGRDVQRLFLAFQRQLELTFLVPPFRGQDLPWYDLRVQPELDLTSTGGSSDQASRVASTLAYRRELEARISDWIERITGAKVNAELVPQKHITVQAQSTLSKNRKIRVNIVNEGYGSNQLVHLMTQIALAPEGSSICIDDPEIHLHPKAQAELAEVILEIAKEEQKQIILTTHSEHMLFRFLSSVADGKLASNELAIYYFVKKDGATVEKQLKIDEKGVLDEGLPGFFEADISELKKHLEALIKKEER